MRKTTIGFACVVALGIVCKASAAPGVVIYEDFEGYADTAAMAAVWVGTEGRLDMQLDYDYDGVPDELGRYAYHPGGVTNKLNLPYTVTATETEWIRLSVDIFDDDTSLDPTFPLNPNVKRMSLGMRDTTMPSNILELGVTGSLPDVHYAYRAVLFGQPAAEPNWAGWDMGSELLGQDVVPVNRFRGAGWHRYIVTITPDNLIFELDLGRDGSIDGMDMYDVGLATSPAGFNQLRFGGPSDVTSAGGGVHFDNIRLELFSPINLPGDLDADGFVGISDLNIVLGNWHATVAAGNPLLGDPSGDGFVGIVDLGIILSNWNAGIPSGAPGVNLVPEPGSVTLLVFGSTICLFHMRAIR
jgi:hypothetical protein